MRAHLIFSHQLFEELGDTTKDTLYILVEDDLFFRQFPFHVQKLILHRASMQRYAAALKDKKLAVEYIATDATTTSLNNLTRTLKQHEITHITYYDVVDDWLERQLARLSKDLNIPREIHQTPNFMTSNGQIVDFFEHNPKRMSSFYSWQRTRLQILMEENGKPVGGKWSYDQSNRKKLPKKITLPPAYPDRQTPEVIEAIAWVKQHFPNNPGNPDSFAYPVTHEQAKVWLKHFLIERFEQFGPYEDAIAKDQSQLFHSALSAALNIGLLMPGQVVATLLEYAEKHSISIESTEGYIRQIIGWREYMRAMYVLHGSTMRTQNRMDLHRAIDKSWWTGETGIDPIDTTIHRVLDTAYAHHIERLMILGNSMLLLRFDPDQVYEWFMSLFIDAYDWVMVPNVYAMSQYAADSLITTKPYVSGSNYILKMSDYPSGEWTATWDALYWQFIDDYRELFASNYRSSVMVHLYDRMSDERKDAIKKEAMLWLNK